MSYYHDFGYDREEVYGPEHDYEEDLSFKSLCLICANYDDGYCLKYPRMPDYFFGRKKKCKYFDDLKNYPIPEDW